MRAAAMRAQAVPAAAPLLRLLVLLVVAVLLCGTASGSHIRSALMTWKRTTAVPRNVTFTMQMGWEPGRAPATISVNMGDGQSVTVASPLMLSLNSTTYEVTRSVWSYLYAATGVYTVTYNTCCRVNLQTQGGGSANAIVRTVVDLTSADYGSPQGFAPSVIVLPFTAPAAPILTYQLSVFDPDGSEVNCSMATSAESGVSVPAQSSVSLAVSRSCLLTWNVSSLPAGNRYAAQVKLSSFNSASYLDVLLFVSSLNSTSLPRCTLSFAGSVLPLYVGENTTFTALGYFPTYVPWFFTLRASDLPGTNTFSPSLLTRAVAPVLTSVSIFPQASEKGQTFLGSVRFDADSDSLGGTTSCTFTMVVRPARPSIVVSGNGTHASGLTGAGETTFSCFGSLIVAFNATSEDALIVATNYSTTFPAGVGSVAVERVTNSSSGWLESVFRVSFGAACTTPAGAGPFALTFAFVDSFGSRTNSSVLFRRQLPALNASAAPALSRVAVSAYTSTGSALDGGRVAATAWSNVSDIRNVLASAPGLTVVWTRSLAVCVQESAASGVSSDAATSSALPWVQLVSLTSLAASASAAFRVEYTAACALASVSVNVSAPADLPEDDASLALLGSLPAALETLRANRTWIVSVAARASTQLAAFAAGGGGFGAAASAAPSSSLAPSAVPECVAGTWLLARWSSEASAAAALLGGAATHNASVAACTACPSGAVCVGGPAPAVLCPHGTYRNNASVLASDNGQRELDLGEWCAPCPRDTFCNASGLAAPLPCPAGTATAGVGATEGAACVSPSQPANCSAGSFVNESSATRCTPCPPGTFCPGANAAQPVPCARMHYANESGSTACALCPAATLAVGEGALQCTSADAAAAALDAAPPLPAALAGDLRALVAGARAAALLDELRSLDAAWNASLAAADPLCAALRAIDLPHAANCSEPAPLSAPCEPAPPASCNCSSDCPVNCTQWEAVCAPPAQAPNCSLCPLPEPPSINCSLCPLPEPLNCTVCDALNCSLCPPGTGTAAPTPPPASSGAGSEQCLMGASAQVAVLSVLGVLLVCALVGVAWLLWHFVARPRRRRRAALRSVGSEGDVEYSRVMAASPLSGQQTPSSSRGPTPGWMHDVPLADIPLSRALAEHDPRTPGLLVVDMSGQRSASATSAASSQPERPSEGRPNASPGGTTAPPPAPAPPPPLPIPNVPKLELYDPARYARRRQQGTYERNFQENLAAFALPGDVPPLPRSVVRTQSVRHPSSSPPLSASASPPLAAAPAGAPVAAGGALSPLGQLQGPGPDMGSGATADMLAPAAHSGTPSAAAGSSSAASPRPERRPAQLPADFILASFAQSAARSVGPWVSADLRMRRRRGPGESAAAQARGAAPPGAVALESRERDRERPAPPPRSSRTSGDELSEGDRDDDGSGSERVAADDRKRNDAAY